MSIAYTLAIRALKVTLRASIRFVAVIGAYLIASGHGVVPAAILQSLEAAWPHAAAFAVLGFGLDLFFRTDRALWRYVSIVDIGPIVRTSVLSAAIFLAFNFFLERGASLPRSTMLILPVLDIILTLALVLARRIVPSGPGQSSGSSSCPPNLPVLASASPEIETPMSVQPFSSISGSAARNRVRAVATRPPWRRSPRSRRRTGCRASRSGWRACSRRSGAGA